VAEVRGMTGVELIIAALVAGASAGTGDAAKAAVADAYQGLRNLLRDRLTGRGRAEEALDAVEVAPQTWTTDLASALADVQADRDETVLEAARRLLGHADPAGSATGRYRIDARHARSVHVGNVTFNMPQNQGAAGTFPGTVNIYGGSAVPPTPPGAV
jgi:hypothetical protein